jgi:pimeloyl-ACP methyl ester carboxylesterase
VADRLDGPGWLAVSVWGVVLVHGANHTAACWDTVLVYLVAPAVAVDLPGRSSRPAEVTAVTLDDAVHAVIDSADHADSNGSCSSATRWVQSRSPRPRGGIRSGSPTLSMSPASCLHPARARRSSSSAPTCRRGRLRRSTRMSRFGNDLTDAQWAEHWTKMVPQAAGLWNARLSGYPRGIPVTYVSMTEDVGVPPALADQMIANLGAGVEHRVLPAGHTVMVSKPRELAAIINDVVGRNESPNLPPAPFEEEVVRE